MTSVSSHLLLRYWPRPQRTLLPIRSASPTACRKETTGARSRSEWDTRPDIRLWWRSLPEPSAPTAFSSTTSTPTPFNSSHRTFARSSVPSASRLTTVWTESSTSALRSLRFIRSRMLHWRRKSAALSRACSRRRFWPALSSTRWKSDRTSAVFPTSSKTSERYESHKNRKTRKSRATCRHPRIQDSDQVLGSMQTWISSWGSQLSFGTHIRLRIRLLNIHGKLNSFLCLRARGSTPTRNCFCAVTISFHLFSAAIRRHGQLDLRHSGKLEDHAKTLQPKTGWDGDVAEGEGQRLAAKCWCSEVGLCRKNVCRGRSLTKLQISLSSQQKNCCDKHTWTKFFSWWQTFSPHLHSHNLSFGERMLFGLTVSPTPTQT